MTIKIIDIIENVAGMGDGVTVKFEWDGQPIVFERWHTENTGGEDYYTDAGEPWLPNEEIEDALSTFMEDLLQEYGTARQKYVLPALETAVAITIAASEAMGDEPAYAELGGVLM